jgi:hypothetical protein
MEGINDIMDEVMEYEPKTLVPNHNDHILDTNGNDYDIDQMDKIDAGGGTDGVPLLVVKPCLIDLVKDGWKKLDEMNIRKVRLVADE